MLPPKLRHMPGFLAVSGEKIGKNPFFWTPFFRTKCCNFFLNSNYIALYQKMFLDLIPDLGKCPNQKHANTCICVFYVFSCLGTSQGPGSNPKAVFFNKVLCNYCSKLKLERFVPKNDVPKNGLPIVFSKSDLGRGDIFFCQKIFLKKPKTP